ncbi:recombination regulator RecX [Robbsia sp. KACC 23696]|uniref:recombination regulator RecX n=1 Tax=Robbsia sp. KACC 23696 TaxID=3149231 RepID=UPI00325AD6E4
MRNGFSRGRGTAWRGSSDSSEPSGVAPESRRSAASRPPRSLKARALDYLSRREYSRVELMRKLAPFAAAQCEAAAQDEARAHAEVEVEDPLPALLDALEREGWLSDSRFTDSVVHRKATRFGTSRIVGELKQHAIDADRLAEVRETLRETEASRARGVWQRKFGTLPDSPQARAKQARFLAARGFSIDVIRRLLSASDEELPE